MLKIIKKDDIIFYYKEKNKMSEKKDVNIVLNTMVIA